MLDGWAPYAIIAAVALVLAGATVLLARIAWRRQVRRYLVGLVGRREAIGAALKTAESGVRALAAGTVDELIAFSAEDSEERRTFAEIAERMRIETAELADLALPKRLWPLADSLQTAARSLGEQVGGVGDSAGDAVLDALGALDLEPARVALREADAHLASASTAYDLVDSAVYGGGLYI